MCTLVGVDDGQDLSDTLSYVVDPVELGGGTAGDLLGSELDELGLEVVELLGEVVLALAPELGGLNFRAL